MIRSEEKNDIKDKFLNSGARSKEGRQHQQTWNSSSEKKEVKLEITHHPHWLSSSPLWRKRLSHKSPNTPLLSALVTSDWPHAYKSDNPTTIKHMRFFYLLIPYQHVYMNPVISFQYNCWNFYVPSYSLFLQLCFCSFLTTIHWYNKVYW